MINKNNTLILNKNSVEPKLTDLNLILTRN